jgi:hypothetical protein
MKGILQHCNRVAYLSLKIKEVWAGCQTARWEANERANGQTRGYES